MEGLIWVHLRVWKTWECNESAHPGLLTTHLPFLAPSWPLNRISLALRPSRPLYSHSISGHFWWSTGNQCHCRAETKLFQFLMHRMIKLMLSEDAGCKKCRRTSRNLLHHSWHQLYCMFLFVTMERVLWPFFPPSVSTPKSQLANSLW